MTKHILTASIFLFCFFAAYAQNDSIQARIVIIGDAGSFHPDAQHKERQYVVDAVKKMIPLDEKTTILYVGDNLYYSGLPDDALRTYDIRRQVLDSQMDIALDTKAKVYFIPGNHDWNKMQPGGWEAIQREQRYIDEQGNGKNVQFYPKDGCPGPVEVDVNDQVVMILMDSQWWLHLYEKPGIESDCGAKTKEEVLSQIDDIISRNAGKLILFACHHPFKSYGIHGGYFTIKQHIFPFTDLQPNLYIPLPVVGSIYPITRGVFGTTQDLHAPIYQNMIRDLQSVLKQNSNVIYVAGHEHDLQLIKDSSSYYVISGAGTKKTRVGHNKKHLLYGAQQYGFVVLSVSKNKWVDFSYYNVNQDSVSRPYDSTLMNFAQIKKEAVDTEKSVVAVPFKDSVIGMVHPAYDSVNSFHRFILGDNYRSAWATPVPFKTFYINKLDGGFKVESLGGGKQTASLHLSAKNGQAFTLRSINKDPAKVLPDNFRGTIAEYIVQDMISASHPFAPLAVPDLEKAVDVPASYPKLYYVPNDPALGIYRSKFNNEAVLLEQRNPTINGVDDTKSTAKIINQLVDDNDNRIDQKEVLRARLIDMLIGDFDRHFDQWRWGTLDTGKGKLYYAIPRDRDQAFFYSDGLALKLASLQLLPYLKGFRYDMPKINWFNYSARDFDRIFLNRLNENDWEQTASFVQQKITDSVIATAINKMPSEIVAQDGKVISDKLKSRRSILEKEALTYYKFISKKVNIVGSNDKEFFHLSPVGDSLQVNVYKRKKETNDTTSLIYSRVFDPHITRELRLYGLNGSDMFYIDSQLTSKIKVRIIGGKGKDTFNINGRVRNYVYDFAPDTNYFVHASRTKNLISSRADVNNYSVTEFNYNISRFPRLNLGYNPDDGFLAGIGFLRRTYGFRKEPFATEQRLTTLHAFSTRAYRINYQGEFNDVIGRTDLLVNASFVDPTLNNFFGFGNETKIADSLSLDYYRVRYRYIEADVLFRKRVGSVLSILAGPTVFHYWNEPNDNNNKILSSPSVIGLDSADVYSKKTYVGGKIAIVVNNLDNVLLPTRGIDWVTEFTSLGGASKTSQPYTSLRTDMAVHAALTDPAKVVAVLRVGAGKILSRNYEYFQTLNLGANNFLRGFRKDRFSGTSLLYGSLEMRVKLFTSRSYVLPGDVGVIGFNDLGRVWLRGEHSERWHDAYGGGFYYAAYNFVLLSATMAFSKEDHVFNFTLGTKFNLTF
ncbi:MAG: BamA/TamA family outer membrane protein [Parafilimonas sp.]|nr:BamA/TamA family outer membrane protein [Parafilimonas sp.]